jgi:hypothetical protein
MRPVQVQIPGSADRGGTLARKPPVITLLTKAANTDAGQRKAKVSPAMSHLLD